MALNEEQSGINSEVSSSEGVFMTRQESFSSQENIVGDEEDAGKPASNRGSPLIGPNIPLDDESRLSVAKQVELEAGNAIKYRTCSWQKTAALLFSEYICLAIMSFPHSYAVLGLVPGLILTAVVAGLVLYTSLIIWRYCLRYPDIKDICDIGQRLFWNSSVVWYLTAAMFLLNNIFIQGLHCLVGAQYLNTITNHGTCTVVFAAATAVISFFGSLPRTFSSLSNLATVSALFTFISVVLATVFAGIEEHPANYNPDPSYTGPDGKKLGGEPIVTAFPIAGTTFVEGMGAFLNISYTFIGQITLPSFIAEMRNPKEFNKALWAVTIAEVVVFSVVGSVMYVYTGNQYMTSPAFGSLSNEVYKKVSFSFMVPTLIFLGVLYASVSARFIFFRLFEGTRHISNHTLIGWSSWIGILAGSWVLAFIVAEVIPFFSDLLSIMSSLFDSFFGFIFWGVAYLRMQTADETANPGQCRGIKGWTGYIANIVIIGIGLFFLGPGTYVAINSVILDYQSGKFGTAFTCSDTSL